jgi:aspartate/methionine/tyrosine aminotransferase
MIKLDNKKLPIPLSIENLRKFCPLKWHQDIPDDGIAMGMADIDFKGPEGLVDFLKSRLDENFSFYGHYEGLQSAINVGKHFLENKGIPKFETKKIQIIPGTMIGIYAVMEWASRKSGNVAIINPIYPPIHKHAEETGNKIKWINLDIKDSWHLDPEKLKENINSDTKLLVLNNPNNPTGTVFNDIDIKLISDLAEDFNFTCFVDELYYPLMFQNHNHVSLASLAGLHGRSISLHGFSKTYGLAGWRSGFLFIDHPDLKQIKYIIEQLLVSPSPIASSVMEFALSEQAVKKWQNSFNKQIELNTNMAVELLNDSGFKCIKPEGTFFVFPNINRNGTVFRNPLLEHYGVEIVPGSEFGPAGNEFIRINCATTSERMEIGLKRIIKALISI